MKFYARWFVLLVLAGDLSAAWDVTSTTTLPAPNGLTFTEQKLASAGGRATLWSVTFSSKTHSFAVMDNPQGEFDLGSACVKRGALAGVNGGYFHPDRTPLGLVVRQGVQIHPLEKAKLLSGVVSVNGKGIAVSRRAAFAASGVREALQAGPFLVEAGQPIAGLNGTRGAARTVVIQNAKGRFGFLICKSVSLAEMAEILATPAVFPEARVTRALNLDGGSSTALWVRGEPPFYQREWKGVRNYLAIVPKP
ncbi:MAG: phosphodiester glycosidase [Chthoniobacter sp.]|jgi:uncharacterized protein YigE (DUF2233 family)|nr:phosphodiester glycosidase [Chthoniobacter sp.]